jgi:DNA-binding IclR family transcriptional regulator
MKPSAPAALPAVRKSAQTSGPPRPARSARRPVAGRGNGAGSSLGRMLGTLDVFTENAPVWTVEGIAAAQGYTRATTYRYVGELCDAGLLTRIAQGAYALGPRIIELDRQIQRGDPLLGAAGQVMQRLLRPDRGQVVLLCSLFREKVLCVQQAGHDRELAVSYARGRPMPLFRGATAKAILAWLPERRLTRLFLENQNEVAKAGLGRTRDEFLAALKAIRRQGHCITHADVDPGVVGLAVPVFAEGGVIGSLSVVFPESRFAERQAGQVIAELQQAADDIKTGLETLAREQGKRRRSASRKLRK